MNPFRSPRAMLPLVPVLALALLGGCSVFDLNGDASQPEPAATNDPQATADCRHDTDRIYAQQNRDQLSERGSSDAPFSSNGQPGMGSQQALNQQYSADQIYSDCLRQGRPSTRPGSAPAGSAPPAASAPVGTAARSGS